MAAHVRGDERAAADPDTFCRGFGLFQRDLQHFPADPGYFLSRAWTRFDGTLAHCVDELRRGLRVPGLQRAARLDDARRVHVAIVCDTGRFRPSRDLQQGHFDGRRHNGEAVLAWLQLSKAIAHGGDA